MQAEYDAVFFIPDLHAITVPHDPSELANRTRVTAAQYIAAGDRSRTSPSSSSSHMFPNTPSWPGR